jgi:hypothetical protein
LRNGGANNSAQSVTRIVLANLRLVRRRWLPLCGRGAFVQREALGKPGFPWSTVENRLFFIVLSRPTGEWRVFQSK